MTGKVAENALEKAGITVNKNMVPFDERSPFITSGIRIGTPAITTRGMSQDDMVKIVALIDAIIEKPDDEDNIVRVKAEVKDLCASFPLYSDLRA
jgi:glycine hydroxymethyltransferase